MQFHTAELGKLVELVKGTNKVNINEQCIYKNLVKNVITTETTVAKMMKQIQHFHQSTWLRL